MRMARVLRLAAVVLVLVGWLVLLRGLYLLPTSTVPELDLEAGPAFGTTLEVYLPAVVLTALLAVLLAVAALSRRGGSAAAVTASGVSGAFALWVLSRDALLAYRPGLAEHLVAVSALSAAALVVAATAGMSARTDLPAPAVPVAPL